MRRGTFKLVRSVITPISYIYLHITFFLSVYTVQSTIIKIKAQSYGQHEYTYTNEYKLLMKTQSINQVRNYYSNISLCVIKITYRFYHWLNFKSYGTDTFYSVNLMLMKFKILLYFQNRSLSIFLSYNICQYLTVKKFTVMCLISSKQTACFLHCNCIFLILTLFIYISSVFVLTLRIYC